MAGYIIGDSSISRAEGMTTWWASVKRQSLFPATRRALASLGDRGVFSLLHILSLLLSPLGYLYVESGTGRVPEGQSR